MDPIKSFKKDLLKVKIYTTNTEMGKAAADYSADIIRDTLRAKAEASVIVATGASQFTFYDALIKKPDLEWNKVIIFHLDEYVGMTDQHPASFRKYLKERFIRHIHPKAVFFLNGDTPDPQEEARKYARMLEKVEIDLACIGIGENGHIAFNDPPVADFNDPELVKIVRLDLDCRRQQLGEGWFPTLEDVPSHALSLTVSGIMRANKISCVVPDERKSEAIYHTIHDKISEKCPATILRTHPDCTLFLDESAARKIT